jgi:hypothetical protein
VQVAETGPSCEDVPDLAGRLAAAGRRLVADRGPVALVVVGSLSARHGPDAPRADDARAPAYDDALLADLADAGPHARAALAGLDPVLAAALDMTAWAPWQVLLGAAGDADVTAQVRAADSPFGAQHVVATWIVTAGADGGAGPGTALRTRAAGTRA